MSQATRDKMDGVKKSHMLVRVRDAAVDKQLFDQILEAFDATKGIKVTKDDCGVVTDPVDNAVVSPVDTGTNTVVVTFALAVPTNAEVDSV